MKNKKVMKRVLVIAIVAAIAGGGIGTGVYVQRSKMTAEVMSVADINSSYWGDEISSSGMVTNDYSQTVEITKDDEIKEVYVEEGQKVQKGDPLLALDTTVASLNFQGKQLEVENLNNQILIAQNELKKLKNTKPYVEPSTPVTPQPATPVTPQVQEMTGSAYNYISETAVPYNQDTADGSEEEPYRYLCTENAYVTGSFLSQTAEEGMHVVLEIRENNEVSGELITAWEIDGTQMAVPDADTRWSVSDHTQLMDDASDADMDVPAVDDGTIADGGGYTQSELNDMIAEQEKKLKDLDLDKRKAELEVEKFKAKSTDGVIYATVTGVVKNLQDKDDLPNDGTPFMEVTGSEGLYVTGGVSELLLDQVKPGQTINVSSWESGVSCEAEITEIKNYPSTEVSSYSEGNQNVSYYPFIAYIEDTTGLRNGEYVDLNMTLSDEEDGNAIYISKGYVRTENGRSYVLKADENDRLVKQYVKTGKIIYGDTVEIKSGLTEDDRIAFPYGKTAKEGIRVVDSDGSYY
ncbi:biotin/lipoyl-binding protein [uncultured Eubacterium sp.]|mgnify:CR=1 FL=1|uniref:biotin/lipoyl-binding protein n=1 Tax=uncultured Eubacterium sp. TaxID=165185 RepID=UPI0025F43991|nr:biotin/lipoyl-binding protein [uncultured Eubacterium sp.]MCI6537995.1 efflux RND transporter periplasmic adaptor subunit [Lachnospiraceae bacterium]